MIDIDTSWEWIAMYGPVQYSTVQYIDTTLDNSGHKYVNKQAGGQDFRGPLWG